MHGNITFISRGAGTSPTTLTGSMPIWDTAIGKRLDGGAA